MAILWTPLNFTTNVFKATDGTQDQILISFQKLFQVSDFMA